MPDPFTRNEIEVKEPMAFATSSHTVYLVKHDSLQWQQTVEVYLSFHDLHAICLTLLNILFADQFTCIQSKGVQRSQKIQWFWMAQNRIGKG